MTGLTNTIASAAHIVVCGCDLPASASPTASLERWDDLPFVGDGYEAARTAIVERVERLLRRVNGT